MTYPATGTPSLLVAAPLGRGRVPEAVLGLHGRVRRLGGAVADDAGAAEAGGALLGGAERGHEGQEEREEVHDSRGNRGLGKASESERMSFVFGLHCKCRGRREEEGGRGRVEPGVNSDVEPNQAFRMEIIIIKDVLPACLICKG